MGRNKEFDREQAIDIAIKVFREKGYSGSTTDDLRLAMGIGRQSFYDSFKGKRELYLEALKKYTRARASEFQEMAQARTSALQIIETMLLKIVSESIEHSHLTCLGVSSVCEFGATDPDISKINENGGILFLETFKNLVSDGQKKNEIRSDMKPLQIAQYLLSILSGLKISAHGGASSTALSQIVNVTITGLKTL